MGLSLVLSKIHTISAGFLSQFVSLIYSAAGENIKHLNFIACAARMSFQHFLCLRGTRHSMGGVILDIPWELKGQGLSRTCFRCFNLTSDEIMEKLSEVTYKWPGPNPSCNASDPSEIRTGRRSFPSGHASISTAAWLFLSLRYLFQLAQKCKNSVYDKQPLITCESKTSSAFQ